MMVALFCQVRPDSYRDRYSPQLKFNNPLITTVNSIFKSSLLFRKFYYFCRPHTGD
jgi:hypothetical protein